MTVAAVSAVLGQVAWRRADEAAREVKRAQQAEEGQKKKAEGTEKQRLRAEAEKKRAEEPPLSCFFFFCRRLLRKALERDKLFLK